MRPIASRTTVLLVVLACLPARADEGPLPALQRVSTTFRFTDEEPPWEMKETVSTGLADQRDRGPHGGRDACCQDSRDLFLGAISRSDERYDRFISPITNPIYFENPRNVTEARLVYLHQKIPLAARGGDIDVLTLQLRAALHDRFSIISTKSGFCTSSSQVMEDGWADVNVGFKYTLLANPAFRRLLSIGVTYELPVGSTRTFQGNGGGLFHPFLTGGVAGDDWQVACAAGLLLPADRSAESSLGYWSNHLSRRVGCTNWHALGEINWYHWLGSGDAVSLPLEGVDVFNFGARGVAGNDMVTGAIGFKYKPSDRLEVGLAWEAPLTDRRDLLDNRLTVDWILRY